MIGWKLAQHLPRLVAVGLLVALGAAVAGADTLLIEQVTLIDGTGRPPAPDMSVLVRDQRIVKVHQGTIDAPQGTTRIGGRGKFLIPGLMDTHIHLEGGRRGAVGTKRELIVDKDTGRRALHGYLYSGITSVYDSGNYAKFILAMRDDERSGRMVSPRIFATGSLFTRPGGYVSSGGGIVIDSYEEGVEKLDELFKQKPDLVKFTREPRGVGLNAQQLPIIPLDVLERLITYCNENGFRTTIHAADQVSARASISAGIDAMAHTVYHTSIDTNLATLIATKKIPVSTSLVVIRNIARVAEDPAFFDEPLFQAILSPSDIQHNKINERKRYIDSGMSKWAESTWLLVAENVRRLYEADAILALGTDRTIGAMVHQELELLVDAGIPPIEAIRIATLNAAIYIGVEDDLGSIEAGKLADMVLLNADPSIDIRNTKTVEAVFKGGHQVDLARLDLPVNQN